MVETNQHERKDEDPTWQLRKYLLLLAILVATVTYVAGLDPPGGVWLDTKDGHRTGNPILPGTRPLPYKLFYYSNATAFAASLVVSILLLFMKDDADARVPAMRVVMGIDVVFLMAAYVAGSCRGRLTTIYASVVCGAVFLFVIVFTMMMRSKEKPGQGDRNTSNGNPKVKEQRKVLMLLAIFVATITYTAGLNSPGGFWEHADQEAGHRNVGPRAGDPVMLERHWVRFVVFLLFNTAAFAASLVIVTLLLSRRLWIHKGPLSILHFAIVVALMGLMVSYAAGSSRKTKTTAYVFSLVGLVAAYIAAVALLPGWDTDEKRPSEPSQTNTDTSTHKEEHKKRRDRSLILLLATLAATVTYQAGLSPPGGVWRDSRNGHIAGDLILPATHARQYQVFFFCNSAAFVTSIIVAMMVQSMDRVSPHALKAAVMLDLLGLIAAYVAGSCRDILSSIYVLVAVAFLVVVILLVVKCLPTMDQQAGPRPPSPPGSDLEARRRQEKEKEENEKKKEKHDNKMEKRRKLLLLLAILAVTVTYQAGFCPPGKFWLEDGDGAHHVGDSVLADNYPRRYKVFFYSNTILHVHEKLQKLVAILRLNGCISFGKSGASANEATTNPRSKDKTYRMRKYLMLISILAASVTYQAGLDPPGGVWPKDGDRHAAGDAALHGSDPGRYHAFFYSNSTCFVASVVVIVLLLQGTLWNSNIPSKVSHSAVVLNLLGLLVAYAVGSSRDWHTSGYVLAMAACMLAYVAIYHVLLCHGDRNKVTENQATDVNRADRV
ncbi:hypothetical protein EJB05_51160, partial [Eragrostis curvula]